MTPLMLACIEDKYEIASLLIKHGHDLKLMITGCKYHHLDIKLTCFPANTHEWFINAAFVGHDLMYAP